MENDRKETEIQQGNLEKLAKKLNELKLSWKHSKKHRLDCKPILDAWNEITRKKGTGNESAEPGHPQKVDNTELIEVISVITILSSSAHEKRHNEIIKNS